MKNRYGLSRDIPDGVKRSVRQRDGFGCVMCGRAIYDYEHIQPEFADAKEHSVDGIVLLCSEHHGLRTRGMLSIDTVLNAVKSPRAKQKGFSFGPFDVGIEPPSVLLGALKARNVQTLIQILGEAVFSIQAPAERGLPFLINARLRDRDGNVIFEIADNEWRTPCDNWDVVVEGPRITIRKKLGDILLQVRSDPPQQLVIERLDMIHRGNRITCREGESLQIETDAGARLTCAGVEIEDCAIALAFDGGAIAVGVGGGSVMIERLESGNFPRTLPPRSTLFPVPRNALCPCGSLKRFKHCHGRFER